MNDYVPHASWMRDIPDDVTVLNLSIPGTHNSCCVEGPLGLAKTQNLDLPDQLNAGIRFLDIRLAQYHGDLCVHHDVVCTEKTYAEVLDNCATFLDEHPSETILMSVDNEGRMDSALGRLAPSRLFCRLSAEDTAACEDDPETFEAMFKAKTWEYVQERPLFHNFAPAPAGSTPPATGSALTPRTTLGELRGKIVLLRRFEAEPGVGFDLTYWPENQCFRSASYPCYDVEDRYQNPGDDDKFEFVVSHLEKAWRGDPEDLYITFASAVNMTARGYSRKINPRLSDHLAQAPPGRVGIVVMDYFESPPELVPNVIKINAVAAAAEPDAPRLAAPLTAARSGTAADSGRSQ